MRVGVRVRVRVRARARARARGRARGRGRGRGKGGGRGGVGGRVGQQTVATLCVCPSMVCTHCFVWKSHTCKRVGEDVRKFMSE